VVLKLAKTISEDELQKQINEDYKFAATVIIRGDLFSLYRNFSYKILFQYLNLKI
jgi:hypothetical protein